MIITTVEVAAIREKREEHRRLVAREFEKLAGHVARERGQIGPHYNGNVHQIQDTVSTLAGAIAAIDVCDELLRDAGVEV